MPSYPALRVPGENQRWQETARDYESKKYLKIFEKYLFKLLWSLRKEGPISIALPWLPEQLYEDSEATMQSDDWPRPFCFGHLIGRVLGIMYIIQLRVDEMESN